MEAITNKFQEVMDSVSGGSHGPYSGKSALLLGAGFVTRPTADVLGKSGVKVTVACRTLEKAKALAKGIPNASAISLDVNNSDALDAEVAKSTSSSA